MAALGGAGALARAEAPASASGSGTWASRAVQGDRPTKPLQSDSLSQADTHLLRFFVLMGCAGLLVMATGCAPQDTSAADAEAVKAKNDAWSKDVASKDASKFAMYYADDATLMLPNEPVLHGIGNIKAVLVPMLQDSNFALSFQVEKVEAAGNLAYTQGPYSMTVTAKDGKPFNDKGKYLTVWKKQADGSWKAIEDILNSDLPQ